MTRVDTAADKLANSISNMDSQQVKSSRSFLNTGKSVSNLKTDFENLTKRIKENQDEFDRFNKAQDRATALFEQSMRRRKKALEELSNQSMPNYGKAIDDLNKKMAALGESQDNTTARMRKAINAIEDANKARRAEIDALSDQGPKAYADRIDKANRSVRELGTTTRATTGEVKKLTAEERRLAVAHDQNYNSSTRFREALAALHKQTQINNNGAGAFRANLAGVRVGLGQLIAFAAPAIGALVQLGGALVAVADAAALAGAALGGALIASIAEAVPVIGLLVVAFKQLFDVIKLSGQKKKEDAANTKAQADASLNLAQHLEDERQAHIALANAQHAVVDARKAAIRNIQDLNAAEKEALLNSQRATLGLIGSQAALAGLVAGGGSALDIASAQLDVKNAQQGVSGSKTTLSRARSDASQARKRGVSGNAQVIAAQQALITQQHQAALAQQQYQNSLLKTNKTLDDYNQKLKALDPAQRKLFDAVVALRKEFTKDWKGITDPIINSFTGIVKGITKALKDPDIQNAFKGLSGATAGAINTSTSFFGTPEAKRLFLQVMKDAKDNLPLIARILRDITVLFGRIAVAAGPFVHIILQGILDFFDEVTAKSADSKDLSDFFNTAFKAASAFWSVITGILDIFVALGQGGGAAAGIDIVKQLGTYLHNIAQELSANPSGTNTYFDNLKTTLGDLGTLFDNLLRIMIKVEETGAFDTLLQVINVFLIPVLEFVLVTLGEITEAIGQFALNHKGLTEVALAFAGVGFAIWKGIGLVSNVYEAVQKLQKAYRILAGTQKAFEAAEAAKAAAATASSATIIAENEAIVVSEGEVAAAAETSWLAILGPIALVIAGIALVGAAVYLLDKKFHFLGPTFDWLKDKFFGVIHYISEHWKGLLILLTGPIGLVVVEIVKHFGDILHGAEWLFNKLKPVFSSIAGVVSWVYNHGIKQILDGLGGIVNFLNGGTLEGAFKSVFGAVLGFATDVYNKVKDLYDKAKELATLGGLIGGGQGKGTTSYNNAVNRAAGISAAYGKGTTSTAASGSNNGSVKSNIPVLATAAGAIGVPYKWGGADLDSGVDCSGLVYAAAKAHGIDLPRTAQEQAKRGYAVAPGDLQPGDLIFYNVKGVNDHEAIYAGNGNMLVASHTGTNVHVLPLDPNYNTARRIMAFTAGIKKSHPSGSDDSGSRGAQAGGAHNTSSNPAVPQTNGQFPSGSKYYLPAIAAAAKKYGVPADLLAAQIQQESGFNPNAVSPSGAVGISQFMPGTARGFKIDPKNPNQSIDAQAKLMSRLIKKYHGDTNMALAAYNAGEGAVDSGKAAHYGETQNYIKSINAGRGAFPGLTASPGGHDTILARKRVNPGSRGGAAINPAIQSIMDFIPDYLTLSVQDILAQARMAFADKSKSGTLALVKVLNEFGGVFDQLAKRYSNLLATQKHKRITNRYKVNGASGNTSVVDIGSDSQDLKNNLTDLGFDRDGLLAQSLAADQAVRQTLRELNATPKKNTARRQLLQGVLNSLRDKQQELGAALDQNTLDIVAAQQAIVQDQIDKITATASRASSNADFASLLAGQGIGSSAGAIDQKISGLQAEKSALIAGPLAAAVRNGDVDTYNKIVDMMTDIDQAIVGATIDRGQAVIDAIQKSNDRALQGNDLLGRLNALGGSSFNSLQGNSSVLANRGQILRSNRAALDFQNFAPDSLTPAQTQAVLDAQRELDVVIQENTDAQRNNTEQIKQARVDRIAQLGDFKTGVNSGITGIFNSLAALNGTTETGGLLSSLNRQATNLNTQGSQFRSELSNQFGISLSNDPRALASQLGGMDFGALEFGMDDNTRATFEDLINKIIGNTGAILDNTSSIQELNGQQSQDWSSSLWQNFRDALFTGNGSVLSTAIPHAATGAHVLSSGLMMVHGGEDVVPARATTWNGGSNININVDNRGEGDVNTLELSQRLAFEMKTR